MTLLLKGHTAYLSDRYSERKESHQELAARVNQAKNLTVVHARMDYRALNRFLPKYLFRA